MMKKQGKRQLNNVLKVEPRSLLPCSTDVMRGSALGLGNREILTEVLIAQLAELIVQAYFYDRNNNQRSA